jgi:hypothetical protein
MVMDVLENTENILEVEVWPEVNIIIEQTLTNVTAAFEFIIDV